MFTRKTFTAFALLVGLGAACSVAQIQRKKAQIAPMSSSDSKLSKCEVHGATLKVEDVDIVYGLVEFPESYLQVQQGSFPHAHSVAMGGCVVSAGSPKFQTVKYCPECRAAEKRWGEAHQATKK